MTNKPTGGQAYPSFPASINGQLQYQGMTLRDAFAIAAMQALIGHEGKEDFKRGKQGVPIISAYAYEYADAMLLEREK